MINRHDIMIGDYVCYADDEGHTFPVVIKEINELGDIATTGDWVREDDMNFIPLTGEILAENGFKRLANGEYEIKYIDQNTSIVWFEGYLYVAISSSFVVQLKRIKFVHQMQHELRSLDVKNKIVLERK